MLCENISTTQNQVSKGLWSKIPRRFKRNVFLRQQSDMYRCTSAAWISGEFIAWHPKHSTRFRSSILCISIGKGPTQTLLPLQHVQQPFLRWPCGCQRIRAIPSRIKRWSMLPPHWSTIWMSYRTTSAYASNSGHSLSSGESFPSIAADILDIPLLHGDLCENIDARNGNGWL